MPSSPEPNSTLKIKRRPYASGAGAPSSLANGELAYNEFSNILYYGALDSGEDPIITAIAGAGAYVTTGTAQTISGAKTFTASVIISLANLSITRSSGPAFVFDSDQIVCLSVSGRAVWQPYNPSTGDHNFNVAFGSGNFIWRAGLSATMTSNTELMRLTNAGLLGIGVTPTEMLDVNSNTLRLRTARTPASATAAGTAGSICWDANYLYICTATNTWRRIAHSTW